MTQLSQIYNRQLLVTNALTRGSTLPCATTNRVPTRNPDKPPHHPSPPPPSTVTDHSLTTMPSLMALPPELLRKILSHADYATLTKLSETCEQLHDECTCESLWRNLAQRRFRVSTNTPSSRRLRAAGPISWRTLYANWHMQRRMPISRHSGPSFRAFARGGGGGGGALMWVTVPAADDCRLKGGALKVTVVLQNVALGRLGLHKEFEVVYANGTGKGSVCEWETDGEETWLERDEVLLAGVEVVVPGAVFEVDALEQLVEIRARVQGNEDGVVVARFVEKEIWEAYDLLPGGWWVRIN